MVVGNPDCTGFEVHILPAAAVREVVALVHILRVPHILEGVLQAHRSPVEADSLGMGNSEGDIDLAGVADNLL